MTNEPPSDFCFSSLCDLLLLTFLLCFSSSCRKPTLLCCSYLILPVLSLLSRGISSSCRMRFPKKRLAPKNTMPCQGPHSTPSFLPVIVQRRNSSFQRNDKRLKLKAKCFARFTQISFKLILLFPFFSLL